MQFFDRASAKTAQPVRIAIVFALLLALALQLVYMTRVSSATWDEPHHLFDGYTVLTKHDYHLNPEVPPLVKMTAALPLPGRGLTVPPDAGHDVPEEAFRDGRVFVFGNGGDAVLGPTRMAAMAFTLLLGLLIYLAAAEMFSPLSGLFALGLFCFDPNFIAHGALVTTDAASACGFLASIYAFYRYLRRPSAPRMVLAGLAAGLLLAAKFTGVLLAPMLLLIVLAEAASSRRPALLPRRMASLGAIAAIALAVLWSFYGFRYRAASDGQAVRPALTEYLASIHDQGGAHVLSALSKVHALPEACLWGLANTRQTEWEDTSYLLGHVLKHGSWKYFPVAFAVKSTLPLLLLLLAACAVAVMRLRWPGRAGGTRWLCLFLPVVVYFAVVMHSSFDIGVRHLLPVYPFLYIVASAGAIALVARWHRAWPALVLLLVWQIATTAHAAPAWMAYGNEAFGGPAEVHDYLSDANTDWGQQLKAAKSWLGENHVADCWIAYFPDGAIEPGDYGIPCRRLPTTDNLWWLDLPQQVPPVISGTVLISDSDLEGIEFGDGALNPYDTFRGLKPDAVLMGGLNVYRGTFAVPLASALVESHGADKLLAAHQAAAALPLAQHAASLAPGSAPVAMTLGDAELAVGDKAAAARAYSAALHSAKTIRPDLQEGIAAAAETKLKALQ